MGSFDVVRRFEDELTQRQNIDIVDASISPDVIKHLSYPGPGTGRQGIGDVCHLVFGAIRAIQVSSDMARSVDDLVADRISARVVHNENDHLTAWTVKPTSTGP